MNEQRWLSQNYFVFFYYMGRIFTLLDTLLGFPILYKYWSSHRVILFLTLMSLAATVLYIPSSSFSILLFVTIVFNAVYPALLPAIESAAGQCSLWKKPIVWIGRLCCFRVYYQPDHWAMGRTSNFMENAKNKAGEGKSNGFFRHLL